MRLSDLKEEITSLFKEHPLSDLPTDILEMLLDYYNLNSYGMATQKMKQLTNSITAPIKTKWLHYFSKRRCTKSN